MLTRRRFIATGAAAAGVTATGYAAWRVLVSDQVEQATAPSTSSTATTTPPRPPRTLVVVQLSGGNDALNTLPPADGRYRDARPTLAVPEAELVALAGTDQWALHPSLAPLASRWQDGTLAAVAGIGFDEQSRSHFAALDTWWSALPGQVRTTGWLGRWLDVTSGPGALNPLRAIALGSGSPALVGEVAPATVVLDPAGFTLQSPAGSDPATVTEAFLATSSPVSDEPLLAAAQQSIPNALAAVELLEAATSGTVGDQPAVGGRDRTSITDLLATAAAIIDLEVGTEVIVVGADGFDTHANQLATHPDLLADLAGGLTSFLDAMAAQGRAEEVLVVTTSEFGRRVQVAGAFALGGLVEGDLPVVVDTRSLYAEALDWLGGPTAEVLDADPERLGLVAV